LMEIFKTFQQNSRHFIVNRSHPLASILSVDAKIDFAADKKSGAGYTSADFHQSGLQISFTINDTPFTMNTVGRHNMENALAATTVAAMIGVPLSVSAGSISQYEGIYRRHQVLGTKNGVTLIDDYAHNPVKCAASIAACQPVARKLIAWFQPHGYVPTKFLRQDFCDEIGKVLRPGDEIWMSEIFYAGGTTTKDISANDLVNDLKAKGHEAYFVENRNDIIDRMRPHFRENTVLLLMGARDPSLETFAGEVWRKL
jgi:UDP-N-acetylmuramate--alanine ligase